MTYRIELPTTALALGENHPVVTTIQAGQVVDLIGPAEDKRFVVVSLNGEQLETSLRTWRPAESRSQGLPRPPGWSKRESGPKKKSPASQKMTRKKVERILSDTVRPLAILLAISAIQLVQGETLPVKNVGHAGVPDAGEIMAASLRRRSITGKQGVALHLYGA